MVILFSTKFHLYLKICKVLFTITATFSFLLSTALSKNFFYGSIKILYFLAAGEFKNILHNLKIF